MKNDLKFRNKTIKNNTPRKFTNNSGQKIFLSSSLKRKKMLENKSNSRYNIHDNNNSSMVESKKNNVKILTPRYDEMIGMSKRLFQNFNKHKNNRKHLYLNNEKSVIISNNCNDDISNNNLSEYNSIISLLDNIINKYNSYANDIFIKIKNYIKKLILEKNEIFNNSYKNLVLMNDKKKPFFDKSNIRIVNRSEINNNKDKNKEDEINQYKLENNNLFRKIRKLYQKINELEKKYKIEKLKYLFFIIEQEKKIAILEKKFDVKKIPLDEATIGKMKELKCYPNYYKPDININEDVIVNNSYNKNKKHPLSSTIRNIKSNNSFLKSRNRNNDIKNKYSFDKEVYPTPKNNQSQIIANLKNNDNKRTNNKSNSKSKSKSQRKAMKLEDISDRNDIPKNISEYSNNVNQFFYEKNFFISHPKLNYVKNSQEKNHFQKLKTKEQLNGISNISNLLSNINLNSKYQKCAVNDFSNFINNSFVNIEKYRNYHNYMNMENKFEEDLKMKRKVSL